MAKDKRLDAFFDSLAQTGIVPNSCAYYELDEKYSPICKKNKNKPASCGGKFSLCELED